MRLKSSSSCRDLIQLNSDFVPDVPADRDGDEGSRPWGREEVNPAAVRPSAAVCSQSLVVFPSCLTDVNELRSPSGSDSL